jgi:hypothetical protein
LPKWSPGSTAAVCPPTAVCCCCEIERRLAVAERLACIEDRRDPASTVHTLADIIRFRLLMIAAS